MPTDAFADRIFEQIEAAPALLTEGDMRILDKSLQGEWTHRAALFFLTMDGQTLCRRIEQDRDFAVGAAAASHMAKEGAEALFNTVLELIKQVQCRITLALCGREDMAQVIAEGEGLGADDHVSVKAEGGTA